jgi:hypothetical protein
MRERRLSRIPPAPPAMEMPRLKRFFFAGVRYWRPCTFQGSHLAGWEPSGRSE